MTPPPLCPGTQRQRGPWGGRAAVARSRHGFSTVRVPRLPDEPYMEAERVSEWRGERMSVWSGRYSCCGDLKLVIERLHARVTNTQQVGQIWRFKFGTGAKFRQQALWASYGYSTASHVSQRNVLWSHEYAALCACVIQRRSQNSRETEHTSFSHVSSSNCCLGFYPNVNSG